MNSQKNFENTGDGNGPDASGRSLHEQVRHLAAMAYAPQTIARMTHVPVRSVTHILMSGTANLSDGDSSDARTRMVAELGTDRAIWRVCLRDAQRSGDTATAQRCQRVLWDLNAQEIHLLHRDVSKANTFQEQFDEVQAILHGPMPVVEPLKADPAVVAYFDALVKEGD